MNRDALLSRLADVINGIELRRPVMVALDGIDAAGKTTLADELVPWCRRHKRPVLRATIDGFGRPKSERYARGEFSPVGYYQDAFDYPFLIERFLKPLHAFEEPVSVIAAKFDFRTDSEALRKEIQIARNTVVLFDGVFLFRPELREYWDLKIFIEIDFETSFKRGVEREAPLPGGPDNIRRKYEARYIPGQQIYMAEVRPRSLADIVIDNNMPQNPRLLFTQEEIL